jgi:hypothetical protein
MQPDGLELFSNGETPHGFHAASSRRGLFLFFFATTFSFMLTLHLSLECQPLSCLNQSHDLVVSTGITRKTSLILTITKSGFLL